ncbi:MAG: discoidin domain-containing protein, partial [Ignavibacteria bacterium]|nr:discoidin domain-containing protein [Ignavibacteria bacterium]
INADPLFVQTFAFTNDGGDNQGENQKNIRGFLQSGSPAIGAGEDVQALIESLDVGGWRYIGEHIEGRLGVTIGEFRPTSSTPTIGAYDYVPQGPDLTPPDVTGATLLDSITLKITFSEPLDPSTAQNPNNYSINNGITVVSALLTGSVVTLTTSPHSYGTYTVTVSNVEDIAGNIVSPTANSADYDWIQDLTPPEVTGATLLDSIKLKIMFSEALDESTAEDKDNYSITNDIEVLSALLSDGAEVTLTTSAHSPGIYSVTVINVEDIAGNVISPQANSADYEFQLDVTPPSLELIQIVDPVELVMDFSEPLDPNPVQNLGNYTISGQLDVLNASLSEDGKRVRLTTTSHIPDFVYTIELQNLTDLAGNVISSAGNSSFYKYLEFPSSSWHEYLIESVTASSTSDPDTSPNKTLDGLGVVDPDPNSRWASLNMPQWIQYDLGSVKSINFIPISFYRWNQGRFYQYSIQISDDESQWIEIISNATSSNQEWTINEFSSVEAQFIRIICLSNSENDWAGLWETRILGPDTITGTNITPVTDFKLFQNYPNPFNPSTSIQYAVRSTQFVSLKVYNVLGSEIATLVNEEKLAGFYEVEFSTTGGDVYNLPSGIYFYRLQAGDFVETKKMILLK